MGASVVATGRNEERLKETLAMLDSASNSYIVADLNSDDELNLLINQLTGIRRCSFMCRHWYDPSYFFFF